MLLTFWVETQQLHNSQARGTFFSTPNGLTSLTHGNKKQQQNSILGGLFYIQQAPMPASAKPKCYLLPSTKANHASDTHLFSSFFCGFSTSHQLQDELHLPNSSTPLQTLVQKLHHTSRHNTGSNSKHNQVRPLATTTTSASQYLHFK